MKTIKLSKITNMVCIALLLFGVVAHAQEDPSSAFKREGFMFEFSVGGGVISFEDTVGNQSFDDTQGAFIFPDLKFGYMLNERLALTLSVPGMIYEIGEYDRHFGSLIPSVQYWVKDRWWIHGGLGLAIDSPALYDIEDNVNDDWNTGISAMASTGYEVYRKNNFALNIQSKLVFGGVKLADNVDRGVVQFSLGVGFSWF